MAKYISQTNVTSCELTGWNKSNILITHRNWGQEKNTTISKLSDECSVPLAAVTQLNSTLFPHPPDHSCKNMIKKILNCTARIVSISFYSRHLCRLPDSAGCRTRTPRRWCRWTHSCRPLSQRWGRRNHPDSKQLKFLSLFYRNP